MFFPRQRKSSRLLKGALIAFAALLIFSLFPVPLEAGEKSEEELLLKEIEELIQRYYLYPSIVEAFPLASLDELSGIFLDPHSGYLSQEEYDSFEEGFLQPFSGVGIQLGRDEARLVVTSTVPGSPAEEAGLASGDELKVVDGKDLSRVSLEEAISLIRGEPGSEVKIQVRRNGQLKEFTLQREKMQLPSVNYSWVSEEVARVKISRFGPGAAEELKDTLNMLQEEGLQGLILDVRGNQGGYVEEALKAADLFIDGPLLRAKDKGGEWEEIISGEKILDPLSMVVLLDGSAASASEIFAAAFKDNSAGFLVGEVSFGKGTIQALFDLEQGGYLLLTTAEFISPGGRAIEANGVEPHFLEADKHSQEEVSREILQKHFQHKEGFLSAFLEEMRRIDGSTPLPLEREGETYYPLRALLHMTGRPIHRLTSTGNYFFFWEGRFYELKLEERKLVFNDAQGAEQEKPVKITEGRTYLHQNFLLEELRFPFL